MIAEFPAGLVLIAAALAAPLVPRALRGSFALAPTVPAFVQLLSIGYGYRLEVEAFGYVLQLVRSDRLSLAFGYVFVIAAFLYAIFSWHAREGFEQPAALVYAGSAVCAVFAGDLLTLFVFWEISAVSSAFVVWGRGTERAFGAGMRYMVVQLVSGML